MLLIQVDQLVKEKESMRAGFHKLSQQSKDFEAAFGKVSKKLS